MAIATRVSNNVLKLQNSHLLNGWPEMMLDNIWLFNQAAGKGAPEQTANDKGAKVYLQSEREYIARELEKASIRMSSDLNYWLFPAYFSETIPLGSGRPIYAQILQARWLKMIELGTRAQTLIEAGVAVTYSDPNNIGVNDTATITVNTSVADEEIRLYFRVADGTPSAGDYRYEVEPITVSNNGAGVVTITGHRSLFVKPSEWARQYLANDPNFNSPNVIDTSTATGFVTAVDVYRVYTDVTTNVELRSANGSLIRSYTGEIINTELSAFRLGYECSATWCDEYPTHVVVNYKAGSPTYNNNIDSELYESCVAYACSQMPNRLGKMSYWALDNYEKWAAPMIHTSGNVTVPIATKLEANSKYGALRGAVQAWSTVMDRRIEKGGKFF